MSVDTHTLEASLALGLFFFVALPALVVGLISAALIVASGERLPRSPLRVGARERGPAR